jgi:hypothetical protein
MSDEPTFWFPAKRYGWGWGLPVRWQGWVVFASYAALLYAGLYFFFDPRRDRAAVALYVLLLTVLLVAICWLKGERPAWRWGNR